MRKHFGFIVGSIAACLGLGLGGVADGVIFPIGAGTGAPPVDDVIPSVGAWGKWSADFPSGAMLASTNDQTGCNNYEATNPAACGQNKAGTMQLTASQSGATLTVTALSALTTGSTTVNNYDYLADVGAGLPNGTYVAAGGPCTSAGLPCSLTLSTSQTLSSRTMYSNPPALQAGGVTTAVNNFAVQGILGNSAAGVDPFQGCFLTFQPGGHSAATSVGLVSHCLDDVIAGSGSALWVLQQPPWPLAPFTQGAPGWSYQTASGGYFQQPNSIGTYGPVVTHEYSFSPTFQSGWGGLMVTGGNSSGLNGQSGQGAGYFIDTADWSVHGPIYLANQTDMFGITYRGLLEGYAPRFSGATAATGSNAMGSDGALYAVAPDDAPGPILAKLTDPFAGYQNSGPGTPSWGLVGDMSAGCWPDLVPAVMQPDPANPTTRQLYVTYSGATGCTSGGSGTVGATHVEFASNVGGSLGTVAYHNLTITGTIPAWINLCVSGFNCNFSLAWDYDDGYILVSDGSWHLGALTISYSGGVYSASMQDLSSTLGSAPPDPTSTACGGGGASGSTLAYKNRQAYHLAIMSFCGDVFVYDIAHSCPSTATPATSGSIISSPTSCSLKDASGNDWVVTTTPVAPVFADQRQSNYQITKNGTFWLAGYELAIVGGAAYGHQAQGTLAFWQNENQTQVPGPGSSAVNHVAGTTPTNSWVSLALAEASGTVTSGQTLTISKQTGVNWWQDAAAIGRNSTVSGVTIACNSGVALYADQAQNQGILEQNPGSSGLTINGCEVGFNRPLTFAGAECINDQTNAQTITLTNVYVHDCSMGIVSGGNNATITITHAVIEHNGGHSASEAGTHNIYLSVGPPNASDNGVCVLDDVYSGGFKNLAPIDPTLALIGFQFKSRLHLCTITNSTFATPEKRGHDSDFAQATVIDLPCGGQYTFGGTTNGTGVVIELGPHTLNDAFNAPVGIIRFGSETSPSTGNCPPGGLGYATNTLTVQGSDTSHKCWIINDTGALDPSKWINVPAVAQYSHGWPVTIKNCNIVNPRATGANDAARLTNSLGVGTTDGGGNTYYATRAAAGIAAYPFIPSPT